MTATHASYADHAWQGRVSIVENVALAHDTYRVRIACPEIAGRIVPGQFIMLRLSGGVDPLLGRPLAVYDVVEEAGRPVGLDIVYLTIGRMTKRLARQLVGETLEIWGPLGNGFPAEEARHLVMVAGGIGQTPFYALAAEYLGRRTFGTPPRRAARADKVTLCYGARSAEYLACVDDFRRLGVDVRLATDDGSQGHHGLVTDLIAPAIGSATQGTRIVCCGPEAMMKATAELAAGQGVPCRVSLETPMACGIGICFSCVAKIRDGAGHWDYRRTCVEGPIFDAADLAWDE